MNKIIDFFKSLFVPRKMIRHRNNPIIIGIVLAVLIVYLYMWPVNSYYSRNTHKLVLKENLESLQVLEYMPKSGNDLQQFVSKINDKGIEVSTDNVISCSNLGCKEAKINVSDNLLGLISKDYLNSGFWFFTNNTINEAAPNEIITAPNITSVNNGIIINEISSLPLTIDGINESDTINTITVTLNNKSRILINNETLYNDIIITDSTITFSEKDNYLVINGIKTSYLIDNYSVIYYVYNPNVTYYEDNYSYIGEDGYVKNIKFVIDLSVNYIQSYEWKYDSTNGFNGNLDTTEYYYLMLNKEGLYYQAHPLSIEDANLVHNGKTLESSAIVSGYNYKKVDLSNLNVNNFGSSFLILIETGYVDNVRTQYLFVSLFDIILMPFLFSILFFILFKKNGRLKKYKEYFNIASISSVLPTIIAFIVIWIYPPVFSYVYLILFGLWYLFSIYRINSYNGPM